MLAPISMISRHANAYAKLAFFPNTFGSKMSSRQKYVIFYGNLLRIHHSWKSGKGGHVEAFLTEAIKTARSERLKPIAKQSPGMPASISSSAVERKIFIGHGGNSEIWKQLKDFIQDRLKLKWAEFDSEPTAGFTTFERLEIMLNEASFAFLVMTAEDEYADGTLHARENVIHEAGLFQGRLGPRKAIILLEEGCTEFSNIRGLKQIRFPKGKISAEFETIRKVLEREGLL